MNSNTQNPTPRTRFDTLVFDLGKVIIDFDPMRVLRRLDGSSPHSAAELLKLLQQSDVLGRFETGRLNSREFFLEVSKLLQIDIGLDEFTAIWSDIFFDEPILDEAFIHRLKPYYRLIILSNTDAMHMNFIKAHFPVLTLFDELVLSYEVGAMKPAEEMFRAAMKASRTTPDRIFYVDDIPENVQAAARWGWTAVLFTGKQQLEGDLIQHAVWPAGDAARITDRTAPL